MVNLKSRFFQKSDICGGLQKGQKALMPALAVVVGKHLRTVQRYLNPEPDGNQEKSTTGVVLLKQVLTKLNQWQILEPKTSKEKAFAHALPDIIKKIEDVLSDDK